VADHAQAGTPTQYPADLDGSVMIDLNFHKTESIMLLTRSMRSYAALAALALGLGPMMASCSNKATEEQMRTIHQLDQTRDGLRMDLQHAQDNLRDAQGKLANADRDLADCQADTRAAQDGLAKWPNVWPDNAEWNPPPPPPPPAVPEKHAKKMKKH